MPAMTYNETINSYLQANYAVLHRALDGVSHEESLRELPGTGNNMHWILGHILVSRNGMCRLLDQPEICDPSFQKFFARGTRSAEPVSVQLDEMMNIYRDSQPYLTEMVLAFDASRDPKRNSELAFLCFHEAYHIGQLGLLRRALGKKGVAG